MNINDIAKVKLSNNRRFETRVRAHFEVETELRQLELIRIHAHEIRKALMSDDWETISAVKEKVGL